MRLVDHDLRCAQLSRYSIQYDCGNGSSHGQGQPANHTKGHMERVGSGRVESRIASRLQMCKWFINTDKRTRAVKYVVYVHFAHHSHTHHLRTRRTKAISGLTHQSQLPPTSTVLSRTVTDADRIIALGGRRASLAPLRICGTINALRRAIGIADVVAARTQPIWLVQRPPPAPSLGAAPHVHV